MPISKKCKKSLYICEKFRCDFFRISKYLNIRLLWIILLNLVQLFTLSKISYSDFFIFLQNRFSTITDKSTEISEKILIFSNCHPHYTQQLAFHVWVALERENYSENIVNETIENIILLHDNDFERLWSNFNNTDKKVLIDLAFAQTNLLSASVLYKNTSASSTIFSTLKRLTQKGILIKTKKYEIDDPFFRDWIVKKRL